MPRGHFETLIMRCMSRGGRTAGAARHAQVTIYLSAYVEAANRDAFMAVKQDLLAAFVDCCERNGARLARNRLQVREGLGFWGLGFRLTSNMLQVRGDLGLRLARHMPQVRGVNRRGEEHLYLVLAQEYPIGNAHACKAHRI